MLIGRPRSLGVGVGVSDALRIGVDAACLANGRGYGRFTRELLAALVETAREHQFVLYGDRGSLRALDLDASERARRRTSRRTSRRRTPRPRTAIARRSTCFGSRARCGETGPTCSGRPPSTPTSRCRRASPSLITIHDTITERYPELTMPSRRARLFWNAKVKLALWQATLVLTVSDFAAREIEEILGVPSDRLRVAGEAAARDLPAEHGERGGTRGAARPAFPAGAPWFTYVGGFTPHKHVDRIVRAHAVLVGEALERGTAFRISCSSARRAPTTSTASAPESTRRSRSAVRRSSCGGRASCPTTSSATCSRERARCSCRRRTKGSAFPPSKRAACGAPVVATTASPLPQLLEGGGFFVAPGDVDALVAGDARAARRRRARAARPHRARARRSPHVARQRARHARRARRRRRARRVAAPPFPPSRDAASLLHGHHVLSAAELRRGRRGRAVARARAGARADITSPSSATTTRIARSRATAIRCRRRIDDGVVVHRLASRIGAGRRRAHAADGPPDRARRDAAPPARRRARSTSSTITTSRSSAVPPRSRSAEAVKLYTAHEHWLVCPTHVLWRHRTRAVPGTPVHALPAQLPAARRSCGAIRGSSSGSSITSTRSSR